MKCVDSVDTKSNHSTRIAVEPSLLAKASHREWRRKLLKTNKLLFVATLSTDLFEPYAKFNTAIIVAQKGVSHNKAKTFFARIANDGYKTKKKERVPCEGSQIENVIGALESKSDIAGMTAYHELDQLSKEWAPEAFISSQKAHWIEFLIGLDSHVRQQAAFYISYGHRLKQNSSEETTQVRVTQKLDVNNTCEPRNIGSFEIRDHFQVQLGGRDEIEDLEEGEVPFVSTSMTENGISNWCAPNIIFDAPAITVATDGSICSSFVQEVPYYAFYKVASLVPHVSIPTDSLYYISYLISLEKWRYIYARKFGKYRIERTILQAPVDENDLLDWNAMASIVCACPAYGIIKSFRNQ